MNADPARSGGKPNKAIIITPIEAEMHMEEGTYPKEDILSMGRGSEIIVYDSGSG